MYGLSEEEVLDTRAKVVEHLKRVYEEVEVIESYIHENVPENAGRLWHLGESIKMMSEADLVVFCPGYKNARGCLVEEAVCNQYNIPCLVINLD
jgi:hypothetical protein